MEKIGEQIWLFIFAMFFMFVLAFYCIFPMDFNDKRSSTEPDDTTVTQYVKESK